MPSRQSKLIKQMEDREVLFHLYITQLILLTVSLFLGLLLFADWASFFEVWELNLNEVIYYGVGSASIVIVIDLLLMKVLPSHFFDDGGVNNKVFGNRPVWHIFILATVVAFTEEILFRGVIQTHFGLVSASIVFAILHIRYLYNWFLFLVVVIVSFFLGFIYMKTGNLWVTVVAHFIIDFVFAVMFKMKQNTTRNEEKKDE